MAHFLQIDIVKLLKNFVDLVVARTEPPPHILVVQDLDLEGEVLLHVLDDHDEVGKLDAQRLLGIRGTRQEGRAHVGADNLKHEGLTRNKLFGSYVYGSYISDIAAILTWISWSVILLMWPFLTFLSQICRGLDPML